jgi:hypothetical protein
MFTTTAEREIVRDIKEKLSFGLVVLLTFISRFESPAT